MTNLKPHSIFLLLVIYFIVFQQKIIGQEKINIGTKISLYSKVLNDTREIYISLPKSYNDTVYTPKKYPVLYFFDGTTHFENLVAQRNWLTRNLYATMPEIILVGITQKDRTSELTPSHIQTPKNWKRANFDTSGNNANFMSFIEKEVKPMINKNYNTNGFEILSGHSFGGLATVNCFVNTPNLYNAYIAIEPSMWWNNTKILQQMENKWVTEKHKGKILFIAKANDPGSGNEHHQALFNLQKKLNNLNDDCNFTWKFQLYNKEDHGSVVIPSEYDALRFLYKGYQLPVKKVMKSPKILITHYKQISKKLGYSIIPDESLVDKLAKICIKQGLLHQAEELLQINKNNYPNSKHSQTQYYNFIKK